MSEKGIWRNRRRPPSGSLALIQMVYGAVAGLYMLAEDIFGAEDDEENNFGTSSFSHIPVTNNFSREPSKTINQHLK